jgi:ribokinase
MRGDGESARLSAYEPGRGPPSVVVVGSINMDYVVRVPRLPGPGETVSGDDVFRNPGGKGANQAVAAARLGQDVAMIGRVGDDDAGRELVRALRAERIDTSHVRVDRDTPTGAAFISVAPDGENVIVVSPGANKRLTSVDVDVAGGLLQRARIILTQLEIPFDAVRAAASGADGIVVLNPAPAQAVPEDLLSMADIVVPNRVELGRLAGIDVPESADEVARAAVELPGRSTVVTLGSDGAIVVRDGEAVSVHPTPVRAVDTTGAGDAFCGALADALARGNELHAAAQWGCRVAALASTKRGAQASLPTREAVLAFR